MRVLHGYTGTKIYEVWASMLRRCRSNKNAAQYYKTQGITYYPAWAYFLEFKKYVDEHLGNQPENTSLDRIDSSKNYEPGNIRWATPTQQSANRRKIYNIKTTSKYIGVSFCKTRNMWCAYIKVEGKTKNLGRYESEKQAAEVYNFHAFKLRGTDAVLNSL